MLLTPKVQTYLTSRRVSRAASRVYGLGYFDLYEVSPFYDRLMFPIRDVYGKLLSFQGRAMFNYEELGKPKYYHAPFDKGSTVYGLYEVAEWSLDAPFLIVVEGPMDVIALWDAGLPAVALMGTTFSMAQAYMIRRYTQTVLLWLDADKAGEEAARLVRAVLDKVSVDVLEVPKHRPFKDAGETWKKAGHDGIKRIISGRR